MPILSMRVPEDSPIWAWLAKMAKKGVSQSDALRHAVLSHIRRGGVAPRPESVPNDEQSEDLAAMQYQIDALRSEVQAMWAMMQQGTHCEPEEANGAAPVSVRAGLLSEILGGLDDWNSQN